MKKLFSIFGDPVAHSRSPLMHNTTFKHLGENASYIRTHLKDGTKLKKKFFSLALDGANVTVPHKEAAFFACDEVRGFAKHVGVVNTLVREENKLIGYNTDADGFMYAIEEFSYIKKILVIGAGGTAKALVMRFLEEGFEVSVLNRSENRLTYFRELQVKTYTWNTFVLEEYSLVINTTSAGLKDDSLPLDKKLLESILNKTQYGADVIYGKKTSFLKLCENKNIASKDGSDMLLGQGVLAHELFTHFKYDKKSIKEQMQKSFDY